MRGLYEHEASNLFASVGLGIRNDFFGLDERHNYDRTLGYEANVGHRDLFFRVSRQIAQGRESGLIESAEGTAIGFTARRSFAVSGGTRFDAALNLDKFAGGEARTIFGTVQMDGVAGIGPCPSISYTNRVRTRCSLPEPRPSVPRGDDVFTAGAKLSVQFQPAARRDGFLTSDAGRRGAGDNFGPVTAGSVR